MAWVAYHQCGTITTIRYWGHRGPLYFESHLHGVN